MRKITIVSGQDVTVKAERRGKGCMGKLISFTFLLVLIGASLILIFGFFIKAQPEYNCAIQIAEESEQVISVTGSPITPGLFAWIKFFEIRGAIRQGGFFTSISGPKGEGTIDVSVYRAPTGDSLGIWFTSHNEEIEVYNGIYPCQE